MYTKNNVDDDDESRLHEVCIAFHHDKRVTQTHAIVLCLLK